MTDTEHVDAEVVIPPPIYDLAIRPVGPDGISLLPVEEQEKVLAEYDKRNNHIKSWIQSHLIETVHYGYPGGKKVDKHGNTIGAASLYKAGALKVIDLYKLKARFSSDNEAWVQAGSIKGLFIRKCVLYTADGIELGEGTGSCQVGEKGGPFKIPNTCLKMADKRAAVAAVINAVPACCEYTQDIEDYEPEPRPQAEPNAGNVGHVTRDGGKPSVLHSPEFAELSEKSKLVYPDEDMHQRLIHCSEIMEAIYREQGKEQACDLAVPTNWKPEIVDALNEHFAEVLSKREVENDCNAN